MKNLPINENSTILECYAHFNEHHNHSDNTKAAYHRNILAFQEFMEAKQVNPSVKNINFLLAKEWTTELREAGFSERTIKQRLASLKSLNNYLINLGILRANVFIEVDKGSINSDERHSRGLSLTELYEVYKAAYQLEQEGKNVLLPTLIDMFTGLRNTSLCKLRVKSITPEGKLEFKHEEKDKNSKNKNLILPLPPKLLALLQQYIKDWNLEPEAHLLYGLRGKPLENKQFNSITRNLCITLGWTTVRDYMPGEVVTDENSMIDDKKVYTNTEKYFTPHGFRYTISTIFSEMGLEENSISYLLNHSDYGKGNVKWYILSQRKYIKEIEIGQLILETLFETALNLEQTNNITLDIERIEHDLPNVFEHVKRDKSEIHRFQNYLINFAFTQAQQQLTNSPSVDKNYMYEQQIGYAHPPIMQQFGSSQPIMMENQVPYQGNPSYQQHQSYGHGVARPMPVYGSHYPNFYKPFN